MEDSNADDRASRAGVGACIRNPCQTWQLGVQYKGKSGERCCNTHNKTSRAKSAAWPSDLIDVPPLFAHSMQCSMLVLPL